MLDRFVELRAIVETSLYVDDLDSAGRFYGGVLGLPELSRRAGRHIFYRLGRGMLLLFVPEATEVDSGADGIDVPNHGARGPGHMAFGIGMEEVDAWRERLEARVVAIEQDLTWPNGARSLYFRDPAGNSLELVTPSLWELPESILVDPAEVIPEAGPPLGAGKD